MAKKLTARQRKARKRAAYIKAEYKKNIDAIKYLGLFGKSVDIEEPDKITMASLKKVRRIYSKLRKEIQEEQRNYYGYVDETGRVFQKLPTKAEMVKEYNEAQEPFNPDEQFIQELKEKIDTLTPKQETIKTRRNLEKNVLPKLEGAKYRFITAIDNAVAQHGVAAVAKALAKNKYMQRVENLEEKYAYQVIKEITEGNDSLINLVEVSVNSALKDV